MSIKTGFNVLLSLCALILTTTALCKLLYFISHTLSPSEIGSHKLKYNETGVVEPGVEDTVWSILVDITLLAMFILQHSGMANANVKEKIHRIGLHVTERSLYIIFTSLTLMLLIHSWHRITWVTIWHANTHEHILLDWLFTLMHSIAWALIIGDTFLSDVFEFVGVKQVYNEFIGHQDPLNSKSPGLCRLYGHVRHSSFICFFILFWVQPMMSLDKLLLALIWTVYMASEWRVDYHDLTYTENRYETCFITKSTKKHT